MRYNGAVEGAVVGMRHSGQAYQAVVRPNMLDPETGRVTLGEDRIRPRVVWVGTPRQFDVAARALEPAGVRRSFRTRCRRGLA